MSRARLQRNIPTAPRQARATNPRILPRHPLLFAHRNIHSKGTYAKFNNLTPAQLGKIKVALHTSHRAALAQPLEERQSSRPLSHLRRLEESWRQGHLPNLVTVKNSLKRCNGKEASVGTAVYLGRRSEMQHSQARQR